jgi:hypothetical protein
MSEKDESRRVPVVAYATFRSFFEKMGETIPGRIDRSALRYTSGALGTLLIHAFRALGLTDDHNHPNAEMEALAAGYAAKDKEPLRKLLHRAYPELLDTKFNLARATQSQVREKFERMSLTGDSVRKAVAFFVAAAKDAGIEVSPYVVASTPARPQGPANAGKMPRARTKKRERKPRTSESTQATSPQGNGFWTQVLDKVPAFDPKWSPEAQANWIKMLERITKQAAGDEEKQ